MKLSIWQRLAMSHGALTAVSVLVGLVGWVLLAQAVGNYQAVDRNVRLVLAAEELGHQFATYRNWQHVFLLTGEPDALNRVNEASTGLDQSLDSLRSQLRTAADRETFEQLVRALSAYRDAWPGAVRAFATAGAQAAFAPLRTLDQPVEVAQRRLVEMNVQDMVSARGIADEQANWTQRLLLAMLPALVLFGMVLTISGTRSLRYPLPSLVSTAEEVAMGNLSPPPMMLSDTDEYGRLQSAMQEMTASLRELIGRVRREAMAVATSSAEVDAASHQQATASAELSSISQEQATTASETAAAVEELSATMEELARTAEAIAERAAACQQAAEHGQAAVTQTGAAIAAAKTSVDVMAERVMGVAEQSRRIGELAALITEVANRTHLLALNAAIEAASAGEHGRRFGVVAREVKALADLTRGEATRVTALVGEIQSGTQQAALISEQATQATERGVHAVDEAADSLASMLAEVRVIALSTQQQRTAAAQVVATIQDMAQAAEQTAQASRQQAEAAEQTAHASLQQRQAASQLQESAHTLQDIVMRFRVGDAKA